MPITQTKHSTLALLVLALCGACSEKAVDLGDDTPPAQLGASLSDYAGQWEGYAEAYEWSDGTDVVRVALDENGNGVLEVGDSDPLPEPDPTQGYPPNHEAQGPFMAPIAVMIPGFSYPIEGAVVESRRIRLGTRSQEVYREWCSLIEPVLDQHNTSEPIYHCLANTGFRSDETGCYLGDVPEEPIDCGLLSCMHICYCDAEACGIYDAGEPDVRLDAALESAGEELVGTLVAGERIVVRMTRTN